MTIVQPLECFLKKFKGIYPMKISNVTWFFCIINIWSGILIKHSRWKFRIFLMGWGGESAFTKFSSWQSSKNVVQKRQCSYYQLFLCKVSTQYVLWREENISYLLNFLIIVSTTSRNKAFFSIIGYHNSRTVSRSAFHNRAQISRSIISVSRNRGHNSEISRTLLTTLITLITHITLRSL